MYLKIYTNQETIFGEIQRRSEKMNGVHCVSLPAPSLSHLMYAMEVIFHYHYYHYLSLFLSDPSPIILYPCH